MVVSLLYSLVLWRCESKYILCVGGENQNYLCFVHTIVFNRHILQINHKQKSLLYLLNEINQTIRSHNKVHHVFKMKENTNLIK